MCPTAIARFVKLLLDIDRCQVISRLTDVYCKKYPQVSLTFDKAYVDRYTGIAISNERILETCGPWASAPSSTARSSRWRCPLGVPPRT